MRYSSLITGFLLLASASCKGLGNSTAPSQAPANFTFGELFLDSFTYPNTDSVHEFSSNLTLFSEDVIGRVDATSNFVGREPNMECIFGLFAELVVNPHAFSLLGTPVGCEVTHLAAIQNVKINSAVVQFYSSLANITYPVEIVFWATHNSLGQISQ